MALNVATATQNDTESTIKIDMIDLHTHILPGVDDGSRSPEQTAQMLEISFRQGVTDVVATPHFYASVDSPTEFLVRRDAALRRLDLRGNMPRIHLGAEVAYFTGISHSDEVELLTIGRTRMLLVEMPFTDWSDSIVEDVCALATHMQLQPVLAHVERYRGRKQFPMYMDYLLENDVLFQCNAGAFVKGMSGRWVMNLLRRGCVHFLGSDCHNLTNRPPRMAEAAWVIAQKLGEQYVDSITQFTRECLFK